MTAWTDYVKQYAKEKNLSYKESLKQAGPSYKQHKENPCPKGHAVCSCSAEPPTPAEVAPPTKKYKKVKLNIIEDKPISRPAIEPPEPQTRELTETKEYKLQFAKKRKRLTKKQQRKKPPSYPPTIYEAIPQKRKLIFPTPYRKVKLNIIEDDAIELPKIEPPPTQTRELIETFETTEEPIKPKKKKSRKVKLDIQGEHIPPLVSKTEEELNKTPIPKLKEMLKELNFTKFAKFKKQDYVDKILELKNIPKGVWWRGEYPWLYDTLKKLYNYLDNTAMFNIEVTKRALLKDINRLEEFKKNRIPGEHGRTQYSLIVRKIERGKEHIKEFDRLNNIDFEKEVEKLEKEHADRKKRFADANKKPEPISRPKIEPPPTQTRILKETIETKEEPIKPPSQSKNEPSDPKFLKEKKDLMFKFSIMKRNIINEAEGDIVLQKAQLFLLKHEFDKEYKQLINKYTGGHRIKTSNMEDID